MIDAKGLVEKKLSSQEIFNGELLHVFGDVALLPDGSSGTREWIKHPGACAIVPVFENGDVMLIKQFRYPVAQLFLEVPAGKIDAGEPPLQTAMRELKEETGIAAKTLSYVGHFYPAIGYSDEVIHIYLASELQEQEQRTDADEFVINHRIPFKEVVQRVHSGEINDGKTVVCILRAWEYWNSKKIL